MSVLDCCNPCATVQTVNIPGAQGDPGLPGVDGADGSMGAITFKTVTPDPTGNTTNNAQLMMGLGASITLLNASSTLIIIVTGTVVTHEATIGQIQLRYNTGAAPSNGNAATGTAIGAVKNIASYLSRESFSLSAVVTGLLPGVAYWIDVGVAKVSAPNHVNIYDVDVVAMEV